MFINDTQFIAGGEKGLLVGYDTRYPSRLPLYCERVIQLMLINPLVIPYGKGCGHYPLFRLSVKLQVATLWSDIVSVCSIYSNNIIATL